jgi:hypothetical protein
LTLPRSPRIRVGAFVWTSSRRPSPTAARVVGRRLAAIARRMRRSSMNILVRTAVKGDERHRRRSRSRSSWTAWTRLQPPPPGAGPRGARTRDRTLPRRAARSRTAGMTRRAGPRTRDRTWPGRGSRGGRRRSASRHQPPALRVHLLQRIADGQTLLPRDSLDLVELGCDGHHPPSKTRHLVRERAERRL